MTTNKKIHLKCLIPGCKTIFGKDKNIKCHKIRKSVIESEKERRKWMEALPFLCESDFLRRRYLMCSLHFRDDDYIHRPLKHFKREIDLKPNVMPSLNLPTISEFKRQRTTKLNRIPESSLVKRNQRKLFQKNSSFRSDLKKATKEKEQILKFQIGTVRKTKTDIFENDSLKNMLLSYPNTSTCKCRKDIKQRTIGIQCENLDIPSVLTDANHDSVVVDKTCDLPDDDLFFNEISKIENKIPKDMKFYCCKICDLTFTDYKPFRDHEGVHAEISLLCYFCGNVSVNYMKHVEHEYKCKISNENGESSLKKKTISKNISKEHFEHELNNEISNLNTISLEDETPKFIGIFCEICNQLFEHQELYNDHLKKTCNTKSDSHVIEDLTEKNNKAYQLSMNTTIEFLDSLTDNYICKICEKSYNTEYLLNRHTDIKHLNPVRKRPLLQCIDCEMKFSHTRKLQAHIREHVIIQKECRICKITHYENDEYIKHLQNFKHCILETAWKSKYNIKMFQCSLCKFEEKAYENLHELANHSDFHRVSKTRQFINGVLAEHEYKYKY